MPNPLLQKHRLNWGLVIRGVLLILIVPTLIGLRLFVWRPSNTFAGSHYNQGKNAAWLGVEWSSEAHTTAQIEQLADALASRQLKYVFAYATYLKASGDFNQTYAYAPSFIKTVHARQPDLVVLAWIGLPLNTGWGYVDLNDTATRKKIVTTALELVRNVGFDGIHIDAEMLYNGDQNVLHLLTELRQALGSTFLSLAVHPGLDQAYAHDLAAHVNQIAVMSYDSGIGVAGGWVYQTWLRFQVIATTKALEGTGVELLFGVPTSEEHTGSHDPGAENMANGLRGIIDGLNDHESTPSAFTGVAIYPYWDTSGDEWATYDHDWLGK